MLFLPQELYTKHHGVRGNGFSAAVLAVACRAANVPNGSDCVDGMHRSMSGFGTLALGGTDGQHQNFGYSGTDGASVTESASKPGVAVAATTAGDNSLVYLTTNGGAGCLADTTSGALSFETTIKDLSSTDRTIVAGLVGPGVTFANLIDASGDINSSPFIGFISDGSAVKVVYAASGQTANVTTLADALPSGEVSLGVTVNRAAYTDEIVTFWVNGERKHTLSPSMVSADDFPKVPVTGIVGIKTLTAAIVQMEIHRVAAIAPV